MIAVLVSSWSATINPNSPLARTPGLKHHLHVARVPLIRVHQPGLIGSQSTLSSSAPILLCLCPYLCPPSLSHPSRPPQHHPRAVNSSLSLSLHPHSSREIGLPFSQADRSLLIPFIFQHAVLFPSFHSFLATTSVVRRRS